MSVDTYGETPKIKNYWKKKALFQLSTTQLYYKIMDNNEGELTELGAINASTGKYTDVHLKINSLLQNLLIKIIFIGEISTNLSMKKLS